ncbi:DUF2806 domain-containing protein [Candidatus Azambacteria bacterium]|nr:DUF2806 domain-containing protein [Candidatus Azambacteria bacterium]
MTIFEKIFGKISFLWRGNKKKISKQHSGQLQVQQEKDGVVNIFNIQNVSIDQIRELTSFKPEKNSNLLGNAQKRFVTEQVMRQQNLASIVKKSSLEDVANPNNLEKDWFLKWMDISQEVSRDEMQDILAKILRGEVQRPGAFSARTLEVVRSLGLRELEIFRKFIALANYNACVLTLGKSILTEFVFDKYDISYNDFLTVSEAGLVSASNSAIILSFKKDQRLQFNIGSKYVTKTATKESDKLPVSALLFTLVGKEIASLIEGENIKKDEYIKDLEIYLDSILCPPTP